MPLWGVYLTCRLAWPKGWPNVELTWAASTSQPGLTQCWSWAWDASTVGDTYELRSTGPNSVLVLAMTCLCQGGYIWAGYIWLQMSTWPYVVLLLVTGCIYGGSTWLKCKKDIWKFEHTSGLGPASQRSFLQKTNNQNAWTNQNKWMISQC